MLHAAVAHETTALRRLTEMEPKYTSLFTKLVDRKTQNRHKYKTGESKQNE